MAEKILSVFIDESGDFGSFALHSPYYMVTMVLHNQSVSLRDEIARLDSALLNNDYPIHAIHTGPLIRRESVYVLDTVDQRRLLFNMLFNFSRRIDFHYTIAKVNKKECADVVDLTSKLSKQIIQSLRNNYEYISEFNKIIVYYDNGQVEMTKILTSVFNALFANVEFRKVTPKDYKLFQVADLICTVELIAEKLKIDKFTKSEQDFFDTVRKFNKNYLKVLRKKRI